MKDSLFKIATGGNLEVPEDWMSASRIRPFMFDDPGITWLEFHGKEHGLEPDSSPYEFFNFIIGKGLDFEKKWIQEMASAAVRVCSEAYEARSLEKFRVTVDLLHQGIPLISQPALWWAPERIYGVPDLIAHTSWFKEIFPKVVDDFNSDAIAANLADNRKKGHYVILDIKFTTKLDQSLKALDFKNYAGQLKLYSYILGHIQGLMPERSFIIARDRIFEPLSVNVISVLDQPLDKDLASIRDSFVEIKTNGRKYTPWDDEIVHINLSNNDERWRSAKNIIAKEKTPGGDPCLLYQIGNIAKNSLKQMGFPNLKSMYEKEPATIPFEHCKGLGPVKSKQIRAILEANRSNSPIFPPSDLIPPRKQREFYIDFEYFTNLNVDFDMQWPTLEGYEMIFMIGIGWVDNDRWAFKYFIADAETPDSEMKMFQDFVEFLNDATDRNLNGSDNVVLYHWTSVESWQLKRASDRHQLPEIHPFRKLPLMDLQKVFLKGPTAIPGSLSYGLKEISNGLGILDSRFQTNWPGELDEGLRAMVMGWKAYEKENPIESEEMNTLKVYLEADCQALCNILRWLRSQ